MIAEIYYTLKGEKFMDSYDFSHMERPPDVAGIEYRFHHRMQLKKTYRCFENELHVGKQTKYEPRYSPDEYSLDSIIIRYPDGSHVTYDQLSYKTTPVVVKK